jgi:GTP-binding protein EngB required for normal cell division
MDTFTYEAFLDEVTTLLTEMYDMEDEAAIKLVMQAQDAEYFVAHDDKPELRTLEQAKIEAVALYQTKQNKVQTQQKQQKRVAVKKRP